MTDIIRLLPDAIANQIAAGEVVQRPASIVKELMENSVDAGSTRVQVLIREAGKVLVQVIDNGKGMSETDARMSFERHATSKIRTAEDLFAIRTMGFRGEALASIAAVAQVEMKTRQHGSELGVRICIEGSEVKEQEPVVAPEGTSIAVKNLFYNVPARRNFLKSNPVEMRHIVEEFQRVALAHPEVAFSLHQNDLETYQLAAGKLSNRIVQLFTKNHQEQMAACREETPHLKLWGYIGKPEFSKKTRGEQYFFVNQRYIKSNYLHHAMMSAYEGLLQADTYPFYVLFLEIDPQEIDINVHPTKTEIKFADERTVYAIVQSAVRQAIGAHNLTPSLDFDQDVNFTSRLAATVNIPDTAAHSRPDRSWEQFRQSSTQQQNLTNWEQLFEANRGGGGGAGATPGGRPPQTIIQPSRAFTQSVMVESAANQLKTTESAEGYDSGVDAQQSVFQLHGRYIICQVKSGMMFIDQEAAHQRILYEKFLKQLQHGSAASQQSLFPQQLQLNRQDMELFQEYEEEIRSLGFELSHFGGDSLVIQGVPADLAGVDSQRLLEGLLEQLKHHRTDLSLGKREQTARALALRAALRWGQRLELAEMRSLIDQLFACQTPAYTPDGRQTFRLLELDKVAELFKQ
ncbi:DNA mismatch repair endonuclease MutL [Cesiribacter sp. SM1]|uniref:DNA mismatch repair endonuclease MutL n=1 Tax=Cesiribacter sp. SM1 TaxID=2861196 RepID=UPI001CD398A8|nr:DNA mismatch repair endonuclease MutL [Cesiribacter sp. SM1]